MPSLMGCFAGCDDRGHPPVGFQREVKLARHQAAHIPAPHGADRASAMIQNVPQNLDCPPI